MNISTDPAARDQPARARDTLAAEPALRAELLALGVDVVWADYGGSAGLGRVENTAYFNSHQPGQVFGLDPEIQARVAALFLALLDLRHPGWLDAAGASGTFAWNLADETLEHEHRPRDADHVHLHVGFDADSGTTTAPSDDG